MFSKIILITGIYLDLSGAAASGPAAAAAFVHGLGGVAVVGEHLLEAGVDGVLGLPPLLEEEQDDGVLQEGAEHQENADNQVQVDGVQP